MPGLPAPGGAGRAPGGSGRPPGPTGRAPGGSGRPSRPTGRAPGGSGRAPGGSGLAPGGSGRTPGGSGRPSRPTGRAPGGSGRTPGGSGRAPGGRGRTPGGSGRPSGPRDRGWLTGAGSPGSGLPGSDLAGSGLPRPTLRGSRLPSARLDRTWLALTRLSGIARLRGTCLPGGRLSLACLAGALAGATLRGACVALVRTGLAGPRRTAATGRRTQLVGDVLAHGRRMALGLHPHGGQLGEQVLGRDPKLFGDLIHARVAQPDLTSLSSLERDAGWPADPLHIRFRNASTAASAATVSVTFRARWTLRRRTARSRQAGCPHR